MCYRLWRSLLQRQNLPCQDLNVHPLLQLLERSLFPRRHDNSAFAFIVSVRLLLLHLCCYRSDWGEAWSVHHQLLDVLDQALVQIAFNCPLCDRG